MQGFLVTELYKAVVSFKVSRKCLLILFFCFFLNLASYLMRSNVSGEFLVVCTFAAACGLALTTGRLQAGVCVHSQVARCLCARASVRACGVFVPGARSGVMPLLILCLWLLCPAALSVCGSSGDEQAAPVWPHKGPACFEVLKTSIYASPWTKSTKPI